MMKLKKLSLFLIAASFCDNNDDLDLDLDEISLTEKENEPKSQAKMPLKAVKEKAINAAKKVKAKVTKLKTKTSDLLSKAKSATSKTTAGISVIKAYAKGIIDTGKQMANNSVAMLEKLTGGQKNHNSELLDNSCPDDIDDIDDNLQQV